MNKSKIISIILFVFGMFFLNIPFVFAKENIEIKNVRVVESSENFNVNNLTFDNTTINSDVVFDNVNDFITYEIEIENSTNKNYTLDAVDNNMNNDNIDIETYSIGTKIEKNSVKLIQIKYQYNNELINQEKISLNGSRIQLRFDTPNTISSNPLTKNNVVLLLSIAFIISIITISLKTRKKSILLLLFLLIPTYVIAKDGYTINMNFDSMEIKGRLLDYDVNIYDDGNLIDSYQKKYGETINTLPDVSKDGYELDGWKDQNNNIVKNDTRVVENLDVNPEFEAIEYNIEYDLKDGEVENPNPTKYTIEDDFTLNNPKGDNTFSGWHDDGDNKNTTNYTFDDDIGDKKIIATYSDNPEVDYVVIHRKQKSNGTYEESERENLKCAATTLITPMTKNYVGYVSPQEQTKEIALDGSTTFTYDYAIATYSFSITDRTYLNNNTTADGTYNYKTNILLSAKERVGYSFKWSDGNTDYDRTLQLKSNLTLTPIYTPKTDTKYKVIHKQKNINNQGYTIKDTFEYTGTTGTEVTPKVNIYEGFISPPPKTVTIEGNGSTTVEYLYTRNEYTLTLEDDNYIETETPSGLYVYGTEITLTAKDREGYTFSKWSNGITTSPYTFYIYEHTIIKPIYTKDDYVITYETNGGVLDTNTKRINPDTQIGELPTPTREGYYFDGWYTAMTDGIKVTADYVPTSSMTLYAKWKKSVKSIITNEVINVRKTKDTTIEITNETEIEEEYTYTSTNTEIATVDQTGKVIGVDIGTTTIKIEGIKSNQFIEITVNVVTNEYVITFNPNGGTISQNSKIIEIGDPIGELPTGTREGYKLNGWYINLQTGTKIDSSYIPDGNIVLYAKWVEISEYTLASEYFVDLCENTTGCEDGSNTDGLIKTNGNEIRYRGSDPNNYMYFNCTDMNNPTSDTCEKWRIIGLFEMNGQKRVKIVRKDSIGSFSWDSTASTTNSGNGINQWGTSNGYEGADIMRELNTDYFKPGVSTNPNWYNGTNNAKTTYNKNLGLKTSSKQLIADATWYTGAAKHGSSLSNQYAAERGTKTGRTCSSSSNCTDGVTRTTTWTGLVGLIYPSDSGYASGNPNCKNNLNTTTNCGDNWLIYYGLTMTPTQGRSDAYTVQIVSGSSSGHVVNTTAAWPQDVHPAAYLVSGIKLKGEGTADSPFIIKK